MSRGQVPGETELQYDPFAEAVVADPYPWYERLRRGPRVHHVGGTDIYVVSRYEDVTAVAKNPGVFSSTGGVGPNWDSHPMMSMYDPPEHTRLRRIVARSFTSKTVETLVPQMQEYTDLFLGRLAESRGGCVVRDFAEPLVANLIADLIGIPDELKPSFRRWSLTVTSGLATSTGRVDADAAERDRRDLVRTIKALLESDTIARSGLIWLMREASEDERLTPRELVAFCVLLLVAGFETTVNGIANGLHAILHRDDARAALIDGPEFNAPLVEELLRFDPPVHSFFRNTLSDFEFSDGSRIPVKSKVMLLFGSACRDESVYEEPDRIRLGRPPPPHVAFGAGPHHCIGAAMARKLNGVVFGRWRDIAGGLRAVDGEVRNCNAIVHGFRALPVRACD